MFLISDASSSYAAEVLGWDACDGRMQLNAAHKFIHDFSGIVIITDRESRGNGLVNRLAETAIAEVGYG